MHIHLLGICGTFMGSLALLAKALGYRVTGQDQQIYPPMSDALQAAIIPVTLGYEPCEDLFSADHIVIGNALSRGNASVEAVLEHRLNFFSGPHWLREQVLTNRQVIAVSGTHGKTTTTSLLAWILDYAGYDPGFLIGGLCQAWPVSARLGSGSYFVIEADEYDTAFFDKASKFMHYRPSLLILNNIEFDHADIFSDLAAIETQFHHLIRTLPKSANIVIPKASESIRRVLEQGCWSKVQIAEDQGFSFSQQAPVHNDTEQASPMQATLYHHQQPLGYLTGSMAFGRHNHQNALSAILAANILGVELPLALEAASCFPGVKRRLEYLGERQGIRFYDDFAHHPSAINSTLNSLKAAFPEKRLVAVIEPRSNSMRMGAHQHQLLQSTQNADKVYWLMPKVGASWRETLRWPTSHHLYNQSSLLIGDLTSELKAGDIVVYMSNGGFEAIQHRSMAAMSNLR